MKRKKAPKVVWPETPMRLKAGQTLRVVFKWSPRVAADKAEKGKA